MWERRENCLELEVQANDTKYVDTEGLDGEVETHGMELCLRGYAVFKYIIQITNISLAKNEGVERSVIGSTGPSGSVRPRLINIVVPKRTVNRQTGRHVPGGHEKAVYIKLVLLTTFSNLCSYMNLSAYALGYYSVFKITIKAVKKPELQVHIPVNPIFDPVPLWENFEMIRFEIRLSLRGLSAELLRVRKGLGIRTVLSRKAGVRIIDSNRYHTLQRSGE
ncbi:hypothetical protein K435DRAFT_797060 [Dendrothele bispora CBS 962.96]|uniref:Uncharacterized protein n=1 Tax=Dendrothele bispora (strain CBS 962.96) TaxID=1314807 RepID=A0A4S8M3T8_DENBC|nr:hypothetical protein K435DRAFT_797060 [Dendrothele bispora CBS 962.96]